MYYGKPLEHDKRLSDYEFIQDLTKVQISFDYFKGGALPQEQVVYF